MVRALEDLQQESERLQPQQDSRTIPPCMPARRRRICRPVFNEDYETIPVTGQVPGGAGWRCGSRGTPWSRISTTAAWCT